MGCGWVGAGDGDGVWCRCLRPLRRVRASEQADKYTWLEDIHGDKSMEWVKAENARTAAVMEKQKPFAELDEAALKVLDSPDKLAFPQFRAGMVYNTWRDKDHVRGIVRRTTLESYLSDDPKWETVIDYDALGKQDKQSWVGHGLDCMAAGRRALHGRAVGERRRRGDLARIQFEGGHVCRGRICDAARQTAGWRGSTRTLC